MTNIFETEITLHTMDELHAAAEESTAFYQALENGDYRKADPAALAAFLDDAVSKTDPEHGLLSLMPGVKMPGDARMDMIYIPSYAVSVAAVYLKNTRPELISDSTWAKLCTMTDLAFEHGIVGHGFDTDHLREVVFTQLRLAGGQEFITRYNGEFRQLSRVLGDHIALHRNLAELVAGDDHPDGLMRWFSHTYEHSGCANVFIRETDANWRGYTRRIFVYGTLMKGQSANYMLQDSIYLGRFALADYCCKNLGPFPGIRPCSGGHVFGEVYCVKDAAIAFLDRYESEGEMYIRTTVEVNSYYGSTTAETYVYASDLPGNPVFGRWNDSLDQRVWYAAYGSNLQAKRFGCYIAGGTCSENGKTYSGCKDPSLWTDSYVEHYPGRMYFGSSSASWNGKGVAFYDPNLYSATGTVMRLYNISLQQFLDVQKQEGASAQWYGRTVYLGLGKNGLPVYTITSKAPHEKNEPDEAYLSLIRDALTLECKEKKRDAESYLKHCVKDSLTLKGRK